MKEQNDSIIHEENIVPKDSIIENNSIIDEEKNPRLKYSAIIDANSKIFEPTSHVDADTFEQEVARVWALLSDEQKLQVYQTMKQQADLNQQFEMDSGIHK